MTVNTVRRDATGSGRAQAAAHGPAGGAEMPVPAPVGRAWGRRPWIFAVVWLLYLIYPAVEAWRYPELWARIAALVGLALFAAVFVGTFMRARTWNREGRPPSVSISESATGLAMMAVLLAAVAPVVGEDVVGAMMYIVVLAVMVLPSRLGWSVAGAVIVAAAVLTHTVPGWESEDMFLAQLVLGAVAAWGVGQLITRNDELRAARESLSELAVVAERERVSRDLHDILGHSLSVVAIKAELAGRLLQGEGPIGARDGARARAEVSDIEDLARESLADVRRTVAQMRSVILDGELASARTALAAAGIEADLPGSGDIVPAVRRELFAWALREAVTNVVRHSGAGRCAVTLGPRRITVDDDGTFPVGPRGDGVGPGGSGLRGLRARAEAAGAVLRLGRGPLGGMRLELEVM